MAQGVRCLLHSRSLLSASLCTPAGGVGWGVPKPHDACSSSSLLTIPAQTASSRLRAAGVNQSFLLESL